MIKPRLRKLLANYSVSIGSDRLLLPIPLVDTLGLEGAMIAELDRMLTYYPTGTMEFVKGGLMAAIRTMGEVPA